ncbi:hypothetical protein ACHAXT_010934 [Thalassiosira profunda]
MTCADAATQTLVEKRRLFGGDDTQKNNAADCNSETNICYDPWRTLRWSLVGLTLHGPYFLHAFARLDRQFGPTTSLSVVATKTAAAQFIVFPPYLAALFGYLGLMEGHTREEISMKVQKRVPEAFAAGCAFWPIANAVNFAAVPGSMRVPYLAAVGGLWNGYLSYVNADCSGDGAAETADT